MAQVRAEEDSVQRGRTTKHSDTSPDALKEEAPPRGLFWFRPNKAYGCRDGARERTDGTASLV